MSVVDDLPGRCRTVFGPEEITEAIEGIADALTDRCAGADPVVIPVLLGALPFVGSLLPRLPFSLELDAAQVSRYRGGTRGTGFDWIHRPGTRLNGRTVIILDDILEAGHTLAGLADWARRGGAAEVVTAVLVRKAAQQRVLEADVIGLEAGPEFLIGFGMDYRGRYRNLPDIRALPRELLDE